MYSLAFAMCISLCLWKSLRSWLAQLKYVEVYSFQFEFHCTWFHCVEPHFTLQLSTWINVFSRRTKQTNKNTHELKGIECLLYSSAGNPVKLPLAIACFQPARHKSAITHFSAGGSSVHFCVISSALQVKLSQLLFQSYNSLRKVRKKQVLK